MSSGFALGCAATCMVRARSAAEIPVVTPFAASMESVKLVPSGERLVDTISGRLSRLQCSSVRVMQINPRPCVAMKLIAAGVTKSAAKTRSPSFSRFSSSTRITILPALISAIISWIELITMSNVSHNSCDRSSIAPHTAPAYPLPDLLSRLFSDHSV